MKSRHLALGVAALFALAACDSKVQTSVPADSAPAASAAAAPAGLVEGQNYTVLSNPIPQQQAGKVEVLEFFGYFCPHCAHLEPVLSKHAKSFKDDMYLRTEHVVWQKEMLPLARLAAAVDMAAAESKDVANSHIFDAMVNQKIKLQEPEVLKKWLGEQTAFDGKKVLAAYESPESHGYRRRQIQSRICRLGVRYEHHRPFGGQSTRRTKSRAVSPFGKCRLKLGFQTAF